MGKNVTKFEYVCLMLSRVGGMFGTTLTGTLAAAFLCELEVIRANRHQENKTLEKQAK